MAQRTDLNWWALRKSDPIPGDVAGLKDASAHYEKIRQALITARESLEAIITRDFDDRMISDAVSKIRDDAKTVRDGLQKAGGRYYVAATAISEYADSLRVAQSQADQAERDAQQAKNAEAAARQNLTNANNKISQAQTSINQYQKLVNDQTKVVRGIQNYSGDPDQKPTASQEQSATNSLRSYNNSLSSAKSDLYRHQAEANQAASDQIMAQRKFSAAEAQLQAALKARDNAAKNAAEKIWNQINNDGQKDTWWDNWGSKIADFIVSIGKWVAETLEKLAKGLIDLAAALAKMVAAYFDGMAALLSGDYEGYLAANAKAAAAMDQALRALASVTEVISDICGALSTILSFAAVVVAFIPGAQVVAGGLLAVGKALGTIGFVSGAISKGINIGLALKDGDTEAAKQYAIGLGISAGIFIGGKVLTVVGKGLKYGQMGTGTKLPVLSKATISKSFNGMSRLASNNIKDVLHPLQSLSTINPLYPHVWPLVKETAKFSWAAVKFNDTYVKPGANTLAPWPTTYTPNICVRQVVVPGFTSTDNFAGGGGGGRSW